MRKLKVYSTILLLISTVAFIGFNLYKKVILDNVPPVVTCKEPERRVPVGITEAELIAGVRAEDGRSGDVSGTLVLEKLSAFSKDGTRIATYAAVDKSKNVGRCEQMLVYEGYEVPKFQMSDSLCFSMGEYVNPLEFVTAESVMDGDLTNTIKYTLEESINTTKAGNYPIEYRVTDSGGKTVYLSTQVEIVEREYTGIEVMLSEYLVYVEKGTEFRSTDYFVGSDIGGDLKIRSKVDTSMEGTYHVDYTVTSGSAKGKARLIVVVE